MMRECIDDIDAVDDIMVEGRILRCMGLRRYFGSRIGDAGLEGTEKHRKIKCKCSNHLDSCSHK
jgi:hypothetical protein